MDWLARKERIVGQLHSATSCQNIHAILGDLTRSFGMTDFTVFTVAGEERIPLSDCIHMTNTPKSFFTRYDQLALEHTGTGLNRFLGLEQPMQWLGKSLPADGDTTPPPILDLLSSYGITMGVLFPASRIAGPRRLVGFSGDREALPSEEVEELSYIVIQILDRISILEQRALWSSTMPTALELECLMKLAEGLEPVMIAQTLSLSSKTVQYLLESICRKVSVTSTEQAVAKAIRLGII